MTLPEALLVFPGWIALVAALALVLASFTAGMFAIVDYLARALTDQR